MKQLAKDTNQEATEKAKKEQTCPLCRSPLVKEALDTGKCQCCGHRFDPEDLQETKGEKQ